MYTLSRCTLIPYTGNDSSMYMEQFLFMYTLSRLTLLFIQETIPPCIKNCTPFPGEHLFPIQVTISPYIRHSSCQMYTLSRLTLLFIQVTIPPCRRKSSFLMYCTPFPGVHLFLIQVTISPYIRNSSCVHPFQVNIIIYTGNNSSMYKEQFLFMYTLSRCTLFPIQKKFLHLQGEVTFRCTPFSGIQFFSTRATVPLTHEIVLSVVHLPGCTLS